ncbi:hypothetical protein WN55_05411 [Dufourea novaeangliae]|uniref:Uncharacterized protein n=1 Tax=Dufourea novaeangliae TaxID=178035 RepID=A0A154P0J8_DUFNO|nr:hypothetical protein WN55_05411 [Dufourea novaeangliae]
MLQGSTITLCGQSSDSRNSVEENSKAVPSSRKRRRSVTDKDYILSKRPYKELELSDSLHNKSRQDLPDKLWNPCQYKSNLPDTLIRLMYWGFGADKFNNIVLHNKEKTIQVQIEYVDKYYIDNDISYTKLFNKKERSFSISFDLTEEKNLKKGRSRNFYPFKLVSIDVKECDILKDFLFTNDNANKCDFYKFIQDRTTKKEFLKRLEFSSTVKKIIEKRKLSQEFEKEIKGSFLDKLVFAVNQPNREELNSIVKSEIEKSKILEDYIKLQERVLCNLTVSEKCKKGGNDISQITYGFNLLMSFLHDMFLHKNMFSINFEGKRYCISNDIIINYKNRFTYVKAYTMNSNIGYSQLFCSKQQKEKSLFSINKQFTFFVEELKNDTFNSEEQVRQAVENFFQSKPTTFYKEGIDKLPGRWEKVIDNNGEYIINSYNFVIQ